MPAATDYNRDGLVARITPSGDVLIVTGFEIAEDLLMTFGEETYLPAVAAFVADLEARGAREIQVFSQRSGYRMLLARFGFFLEQDRMVLRRGDPAAVLRARLDAATLEEMTTCAFDPDCPVRMADGTFRMIGELDVGEEVAEGGLVTAVMRGRHRSGVLLDGLGMGINTAISLEGGWIRVSDHPRAVPFHREAGAEGVSVATLNHRLRIGPWLCADFFETNSRMAELSALSDLALAAMNRQGSR
ncbi:hypothetical protein LAZ40_03345 [Cereibacter sphaeroides]|uniref:hypothetical protein n=1 Tax=Cereibacter sphaeroides TaxID=1063 RepID=UPI001F285C7F|nr:hypothetical protein [Cereibacter sphaeroides]MCE6958091.1 hypothetical protein [Cereibacter sphaeroides]MCE6971422.1 hypothetical protein [Cereibacter sphaeroides]